MTGRAKSSDTARRLLLGLGIIVGALVVLVVAKYWPPWVADLGTQAVDLLFGTGDRIWRQTGGRWVTSMAVIICVCLGLLVMRRQRFVGVTIIEVAIAAGALVALLQPDGW